MNRTKTKFLKGLGAIVLTLAMLITMIPVTEAWADTSMDYTAPVIESATIKEVGQTIYLGQTLTLDIKAYDQDTSISGFHLYASCEGSSGAVGGIGLLPSVPEDNKYSLSISVPFSCEGEWTIDYVRVWDETGLYTDYTLNQTVTVKRKVVEGSTATVTFDKEVYERTEDNLLPNVKYTVEVSGINESLLGIYATFVKKDGSTAYSDLGAMSTGTNTFEGHWEMTHTDGGEFKLESLYYRDANGIENYIETVNDNSFSYVNKITDHSIPTLTSISIDKQGEFVESGEVTITITAKDEHRINAGGTIELRSPISNIPGYAVSLEQIAANETGTEVTMQAKVDVANLAACEWYVSGVLISDIVGNGGYAWGSGINTSDCYFYVDKEGFIEKTYNNVTVRMRDNAYNVYATVTDTMPRRAKLGDIFGDNWVDSLPADETLGAFVGWQYNGQLVNKDTVIQVEYDNATIDLVPKYEKQKIRVSYIYLNGKYSDWGYVDVISEDKLTFGDIMGQVNCPENKDYTFLGWDQEGINLDEYVTSEYVTLIATYDKYPVNVQIAYLDANNTLKVVDEIKDFAAGTTFAQILKSYNADITEWLYSGMMWRDLDEITIDITELNVEANAAYEDKQIVKYDYNWIADSDESKDYGEDARKIDYIVVDKELALSEDRLADIVKETANVDYFDKLTCSNISVGSSDYNKDNYADEVYLYSEYDDVIINLYYIDSKVDELLFKRYYVAKPGEIFYLPAEYNGEKVYWYYDGSNNEYYTGSFVIPEDDDEGRWYYFYMETELPEGAVLHENATLPSTPTTPSTPAVPEDKPVVEMDKEVVVETTTKIEEAIKEAEKNESTTEAAKPVQVVVDMKKEDGTVATVVPVEILEAAKGQNVEVVLDMGDYSWTINGKDIKATDLKDINLEVELNTNNIPSATVEKLAKGQETHQLSLTHNGDFGFKAELTINVGKDNEGQYGNLYYYDSDGKLVFMNAGKIDENGNVSLSFSHASEYVVVISDKPVVVDTSDNTNIALYVCMLLAGAGLMVVSLKKRNTF